MNALQIILIVLGSKLAHFVKRVEVEQPQHIQRPAALINTLKKDA